MKSSWKLQRCAVHSCESDNEETTVNYAAAAGAVEGLSFAAAHIPRIRCKHCSSMQAFVAVRRSARTTAAAAARAAQCLQNFIAEQVKLLTDTEFAQFNDAWKGYVTAAVKCQPWGVDWTADR